MHLPEFRGASATAFHLRRCDLHRCLSSLLCPIAARQADLADVRWCSGGMDVMPAHFSGAIARWVCARARNGVTPSHLEAGKDNAGLAWPFAGATGLVIPSLADSDHSRA